MSEPILYKAIVFHQRQMKPVHILAADVEEAKAEIASCLPGSVLRVIEPAE